VILSVVKVAVQSLGSGVPMGNIWVLVPLAPPAVVALIYLKLVLVALGVTVALPVAILDLASGMSVIWRIGRHELMISFLVERTLSNVIYDSMLKEPPQSFAMAFHVILMFVLFVAIPIHYPLRC